MDNDFKNQEKRIRQVFPPEIIDISRGIETIELYRNYLLTNLSFPVKLTGMEDFDWEGFYVFGPGNKGEYEKLKKSKPSYTDTFSMSKMDDYYDEDYGLFAKVTRLTDKKRFQLPLVNLKALDKDSKNYQLLDDYSSWFVNY